MIGDLFLGGPMSKKIVLETGRVSWVEMLGLLQLYIRRLPVLLVNCL